MNNQKLLEKYRKKMSIYFTIFVLFSIWTIIWFFEISQYISLDSKDKKTLEIKYAQINNVIKNKSIYKKAKEVTLTKVINKILEDSLIIYKGKAIIHSMEWVQEINDLNKNTFTNKDDYKYLQKDIIDNDKKKYSVLIRTKQKKSLEDLKWDFLYLLLLSLPFSILFYIIWYFFVGRNLKPIKENIKNLQNFTWNINHEFKTPISEILSSLELSEKSWKYKEAVKQSIESAKKINNILNSLMWLMNINTYSYKKEKIDTIPFLKDIIKSYNNQCKSKNINIIFQTETPQYITKLDKQHLHICFSNILSNAIKYSHKKSDIEVIIKWNIIEIKDSGQWIDKKNLNKIFDRYFRESYNKNGLWVGLSLVKKICDTNKWEIKIDSKKDIWTTVSLII